MLRSLFRNLSTAFIYFFLLKLINFLILIKPVGVPIIFKDFTTLITKNQHLVVPQPAGELHLFFF